MRQNKWLLMRGSLQSNAPLSVRQLNVNLRFPSFHDKLMGYNQARSVIKRDSHLLF